MTDLRTRLRAANDRCGLFPEIRRNEDGTYTVRGDAFIAFLELRNLSTEIDNALWRLEELEKQAAEFVTVPRLDPTIACPVTYTFASEKRYPRPGVYLGDEYLGLFELGEHVGGKPTPDGAVYVGVAVEDGRERWMTDEEFQALWETGSRIMGA